MMLMTMAIIEIESSLLFLRRQNLSMSKKYFCHGPSMYENESLNRRIHVGYN